MTKPIPQPEPKKRATPDKWASASQAARRLARLDEAEQAELAQAPSDIRAKYDARRAGVIEDTADDVRVIVERMRAGEAAS